MRAVVIGCSRWAVLEWSPDAGYRVTGPVQQQGRELGLRHYEDQKAFAAVWSAGIV
jgi:hypothetical protein